MITYKQLIEEIESYRGFHKAPSPEQDTSSPLHDLSKTYPEDIYGPKGAQYYGHRGHYHSMDIESINTIQSSRGKPDKKVKIYRAVPKTQSSPETPKMEINKGDWVTINRGYAKEHGQSHLRGKYKILSKSVPAKHIFTNGDSIHEYGYHNTDI